MTKLDQLFADGSVRREAQQAKSMADLARRIGVNENTLKSNMRGRGLTLAALQRSAANVNAAVAVDSFEATWQEQERTPTFDGEPTRETQATPLGEKWLNVAAFDEAEVPLPAIGPGYHVRAKSTLLRPDGSIAAQWIKARADEPTIEDVISAFKVAANDEIPRATPIVGPTHGNDDLLSAYLIGDSHIGMHAWKASAGSNFDLKIAERNMLGAIDKLVTVSPDSKHGLIINAGDYTHSDGRANQTTKGTPVDVDGRWPRVLETAMRIMQRIVARALEKHDHVTLINEIGNHDTNTAIYIGLALAMYYENEPRVTVDTSPQFFHWYRFGKVLIGTHHGHLVKPADLPGVMACDRAEDWGETFFRYFFNGHVHHERVREYPGCIVEHLRSPAPSDDWHHGQGYRSGHDIKLDVFDRNKGRIVRHVVGIEAAA